MNSESQQCTHEPCLCVVQETTGVDAYCSETCRAADGEEEQEMCHCGHPPCDVV